MNKIRSRNFLVTFLAVAYVSVPKDLSRVKTKLAFGLTKRQLICFSIAAVIGIPTYIFTRGIIGNSAAALLMIAVMFPYFFLAMYEKDGQPAEKILRNYLRSAVFWPIKRIFKTDNFYSILEIEGDNFAEKIKATTKTPVDTGRSGAKASKRKPR